MSSCFGIMEWSALVVILSKPFLRSKGSGRSARSVAVCDATIARLDRLRSKLIQRSSENNPRFPVTIST